MAKKEDVKEAVYQVGSVPTETAPRVFNGNDPEEVFTVEQSLAWIMNKLVELEKKIIG